MNTPADIARAVAGLRRDCGLPIDLAVRGPVPLNRLFAETELSHVALPDLTRGKVTGHLRREGVDVGELGDPSEPLDGFLFTAGRVGWAFVSEDRRNVLPRRRANAPQEPNSPFDYEVLRNQARARAVEEMTNLERLALAACSDRPTLVDGQLDRVTGEPSGGPLLVGVLKSHASAYFAGFDAGWRTLNTLEPGERTPVFRIAAEGRLSVATWYLKLAGGPTLAPNWGYVRVEVPWAQFAGDFGFVGRLSRWLLDARCRAGSYARMPVSLEPVVRAECGLKPLFTPTEVLVNRLYRAAGLFRRGEL